MKYADFEKIMSPQRMERYVTACGGDTRKAMTLYRYNLQISQEMFTIVSCFIIRPISLMSWIRSIPCATSRTSTIDTSYVINIYTKIKTLFSWMDIYSNSLLYGLDHINRVCAQINQLKITKIV